MAAAVHLTSNDHMPLMTAIPLIHMMTVPMLNGYACFPLIPITLSMILTYDQCLMPMPMTYDYSAYAYTLYLCLLPIPFMTMLTLMLDGYAYAFAFRLYLSTL